MVTCVTRVRSCGRRQRVRRRGVRRRSSRVDGEDQQERDDEHEPARERVEEALRRLRAVVVRGNARAGDAQRRS